MSLQSAVFAVNDEPYCLWDASLSERSRSFLASIDVDYFDYLLNVHLQSDEVRHASIALKVALHHAIETFFSLTGAFVQAPRHPYAWIAKCSTPQLQSVVRRISVGDDELITPWEGLRISWGNIASLLLRHASFGTNGRDDVPRLFGELWSRLAAQFIDSTERDEYNALKHGFRVSPGGFGMAVGPEEAYGVAPPSRDMRILGHSEFGSAFYRIESIGATKSSRNIKAKQVAFNWSYERVALLLQLTSLSIQNVVSALRAENGFPDCECKFERPAELADFARPWTYSTRVTSMTIDHVVDTAAIPDVPKEVLLNMLRAQRAKTD